MTAVCAATVVVMASGCGSGGDGGGPGEPTDMATTTGLPSGCQPGEVESLLTGFIGSVEAGRRDAALSYVANPPELTRFALYRGPGPGEGRMSPRTPGEVYEDFSKLTLGEDLTLLGAVVGRGAPLAGERSGSAADNPVAGVDFVLASNHRSISGKVGIDCATGRIYTGAMGAHPGLQAEKICGRRLRLGAADPVVCAY